ncbi:MAG: hypothetical protein ACP5PP_03495 [Fervidobacterium sp.]
MKKLRIICLFILTVLVFSVAFSNTEESSINELPNFSAVLVLFNTGGLLYKTLEDGFEIPNDWKVLQVSALRWYVEKKKERPKYFLPIQIPKGTYEVYDENLFVFENGDKYTSTTFGIAKVISEEKIKNILRVSEPANALFFVPGGYRIYYVLQENTLEQFFEIRSPVDKAYVILSSSPEEGTQILYSVRYEAREEKKYLEAEEASAVGLKIFVLGYLEGLGESIHIRNKLINVVRKDWQLIDLYYSRTYDWEPANYVVEITTDEELPAGKVYVYSKIDDKVVPVAVTSMPSISKRGEIEISESWQLYHSWVLTKLHEIGDRVYISGNLYLRGHGDTKIIIRGKDIKDLVISPQGVYEILKSSSDTYEVVIPVSGEVKVSISFNREK